jgi:hypothetical protein
VEDVCYEIRRAEACVDWADHHILFSRPITTRELKFVEEI